MKSFFALTSRQKARMISLLVIMIVLFAFVLMYVAAFANEQQQIQPVENLNVDGSDFSPIANLFVAGANGLLLLVECLVTSAVMLFFSLLLLVPWRIIAIRKGSAVNNTELKISLVMLAVFAAAALIIGLIISRFTMLTIILFLEFVPTAVYLLLSVLPLYLASKRG